MAIREKRFLCGKYLEVEIYPELWEKDTANANRMQTNVLGFEELANYLSKDPRGKKRWTNLRI